jgi:hypothetical protein
MRSPLTDIIAEGLEQLRSAASVKPKRWLLRPAMRFKTIEEGSDKNWIGVLVPNRFTRADPAANQALMVLLQNARERRPLLAGSEGTGNGEDGLQKHEACCSRCLLERRLSAERNSRDGQRLEGIEPRWSWRIPHVRGHLRTRLCMVH